MFQNAQGEATRVAPSRLPAPWLKALKVAFTWFAVAAMVLAVWRSWHFLANAWADAAPGNLIAAVLLWAATHFVAPGVAVLVLGRDRAVDYRAALGVHALRLPAKYIPGGIWHMVGRVADFRELGHERPSLVDFVLMENLVAAGCALGVGAGLLFLFGDTRWGAALAAISLLGFLGLALVPWGMRLVTRSGRIFPADRYLRLLALTVVFWALASTAFVVFLGGFGGNVLDASVPAIYGTYLFSWGAGFVAFFAPQGIGVFEFVSGKLLERQLDLGHAVALMASFRVIVLAGDLLAWAAVFLAVRRLSVR